MKKSLSSGDSVSHKRKKMGNDPVANPSHYQTSAGLEAIDVIEAFFYDDFHLANAFKYLARAGKKDNEIEDLRKAVWYILRRIKKTEEEDR